MKPINLEQLDAELGGVGLTAVGDLAVDGSEVTVVAAETVTQRQLDDAVAAHVAAFSRRDPTVAELVAESRCWR